MIFSKSTFFKLFFLDTLTNPKISQIWFLWHHHYSPLYTAISRKVVGKSARDNPERYCRWLWGHCSSKKFERVVLEATDICLWVLKESNKSRFDSFSRYEQCIDHIPYYLSGLSRAHFFRQPFLETAVWCKWLCSFWQICANQSHNFTDLICDIITSLL